jgi:hypothetical protein
MAGSHFTGPVYSQKGFVGPGQINVVSMATGGAGTQANPWTGWDTAITWSSNTQYYFCDGYFAYSNTLTWPLDIQNLGISTSTGTIIKYTGTGLAIDAGGALGYPHYSNGWDIRISNLFGTTSASGGVRFRQVCRSNIDITFVGAWSSSAVLFSEGTSVLTTFTMKATSAGGKWLWNGFNALGTSAGNSSGCTYHIQAEGLADYGAVMNAVSNSFIYIYTSEGNGGGGLLIQNSGTGSACDHNNIYCYDFEANALYDINVVSGWFNNIYGGIITSVSGCLFGSGWNNYIGATFAAVTNTGSYNSFIGGKWSGFTESGFFTTKLAVWNYTTSALENQLQNGASVYGNTSQGMKYYGTATNAYANAVDLTTVLTGSLSAAKIRVFGSENGNVNVSYGEYLVLKSSTGFTLTTVGTITAGNTFGTMAVQISGNYLQIKYTNAGVVGDSAYAIVFDTVLV